MKPLKRLGTIETCVYVSNSSDVNCCLETELSEHAELVFTRPDNKRSGKSRGKRDVYQDWGALSAAELVRKSPGKLPLTEKRERISTRYSDLSVSVQCKLIGLQRSGNYRSGSNFKPKGAYCEPIDHESHGSSIHGLPIFYAERMTDYLSSLGYHMGKETGAKALQYHELRTIYRHDPARLIAGCASPE